ncbi:MAG: Ca2+-binding EF-hand superfamily protein [Sphingobacteriales bacterium]|jgi:Ca2+-binding EF-hand superfamily protein
MKRTKKSIVFGAIAVLITLCGTVNGQTPQNKEKKGPPSFQELLSKMDTDKDGKLSEKEVKGPLKKSFSKVDADKDGFITKAEFEKAPKPKRREKQGPRN